MLKQLYINNFTLIDTLDIPFNPGFSVITGETGAGKSIILGAINLLLGQRADTKCIKLNTHKCVIEAHFDISRYGMENFFNDCGIDYDAEFTFNDNITLSKNNVVCEGNKVTFKYPNANTLKAESFGEYLEELGVGELQENRFKVDFGDSIDKTLIASLLGDDGSYYITYDMATGEDYV